jgi:hypothetical protein
VLQSLFPLNVVFLDAGAVRQSPLVRRLFGDATSSPLGRCYELAVLYELALLFVRICDDCFVRALSWHLLDIPCEKTCERIMYVHAHTHTG